MDLLLKGQRVIVVGGSRGIGKAVAAEFANEQADVCVTGRDQSTLTGVASEVGSRGGGLFCTSAFDVTKPKLAAAGMTRALSQLGGVDILVWAVSANSRDWAESFRTDVLAAVQLVEHCLPALREGRSPAVVFLGSQAASVGVPTYPSYSAAKAALLSYAASLSRKTATDGIRVVSVSPSEVLFPGGVWDRIRVERPDRFAGAVAAKPFGRFASPEEVAAAVVFLASPRASYISGANLRVDGASQPFLDL